ncbi:unnamed protein product [Macrosiphum euphorbiae]|uniref:Uncharacterized protein n=1 Tax=Macrosiphum euphorbiae TaxID=13131 RepID=A0AAV0XWJ9_9HEMI|nr:unnamed protein product [Macrosiphum euphorbiae]
MMLNGRGRHVGAVCLKNQSPRDVKVCLRVQGSAVVKNYNGVVMTKSILSWVSSLVGECNGWLFEHLRIVVLSSSGSEPVSTDAGILQ